MEKELKNDNIWMRLQKYFKVVPEYKVDRNSRHIIYLYKTIGSYSKIGQKLAYYCLDDRVEILGQDSMGNEKIYETWKIIRLDNNTNFRIEKI